MSRVVLLLLLPPIILVGGDLQDQSDLVTAGLQCIHHVGDGPAHLRWYKKELNVRRHKGNVLFEKVSVSPSET